MWHLKSKRKRQKSQLVRCWRRGSSKGKMIEKGRLERRSLRRIWLATADFEDGRRGPWAKEHKWLLQIENNLQVTARKQGPQYYYCVNWILPTTWMVWEVDSFLEPPEKQNKTKTTDLRTPSSWPTKIQGRKWTVPHCAWTADVKNWKIFKCELF